MTILSISLVKTSRMTRKIRSSSLWSKAGAEAFSFFFRMFSHRRDRNSMSAVKSSSLLPSLAVLMM